MWTHTSKLQSILFLNLLSVLELVYQASLQLAPNISFLPQKMQQS